MVGATGPDALDLGGGAGTPAPLQPTILPGNGFSRTSPLLLPFRRRHWLEACPTATAGRTTSRLLPLDGGRRLAADVVDHPVDALDLVDDPRRDPGQQLIRQVRPIR